MLDFVQDPCFAQGDGLIKVMTCHTRSDYVEHTQRLFFFLTLVCVGEGRERESTCEHNTCVDARGGQKGSHGSGVAGSVSQLV